MKSALPPNNSKFRVAAVAMLAFILTLAASAQTETVLYSFTGASDGASPWGNLIPDGKGNFFGANTVGGSLAGKCKFAGCGNVFELSPNLGGGWTETVLYTFTGGSDGANPESTVTLDAAGNIYGTTVDGGYFGNTSCGLVISGCGVVYKLSLNPDGTWNESVLYTFLGRRDGFLPQTAVSFDAAGNLYGSANLGGAHQVGDVFQLSPDGSGGWTFRVVYAFTNGLDGGRPEALLIDSTGNLFATTPQGGITGGLCQSYGCGAVVELSPNGSGGFSHKVLHDFTGHADGAVPFGLSIDLNGNLVGSAQVGGNRNCVFGPIAGCGVIFQLSLVSGQWQGKGIYLFTGGSDGATPDASLTFDAAGNIYGTSNPVNCPGNCGGVFKLSPIAGGYTETTLHTFTGGADGGSPTFNGVTLDSAGNLFGTTQLGGLTSDCTYNSPSGCGVVYEITP